MAKDEKMKVNRLKDLIDGYWKITASKDNQASLIGTLDIKGSKYVFVQNLNVMIDKKCVHFVPYLANKSGKLRIKLREDLNFDMEIAKIKQPNFIGHMIFPDTGTGTNSFRIRFHSKVNTSSLSPDFSAIPDVNNPYFVSKKIEQ